MRIAPYPRTRTDGASRERRRERLFASFASFARAFVLRPSGRKEILIMSRSGTQRLGDAATPRAEAKWPDRRETAGRRGAFRGRKEGDVPGDHSSLAICTLVYSVVPLGTAPAWKGRIVSRTVGRHVGDGASARARWGTHRKAYTPARVSPAPRPSSGELRSTATPS